MAFRFRRSVKIAPGLRVNFGKRGVSLSAGVRGASVTVGSRGTYGNVGIPGTGLSYRSRIDGGQQRRYQERDQRRIEKEYQRVEKEEHRQEALSNIKLNLNKDDGTLQIENAFGESLDRRDLALLWEQKGHTVKEWLEQQAEEINGDVELLTKIHEDTPDPKSFPEYQINEFEEEPPELPVAPISNPKPVLTTLKPLGFISRLIPSKKKAFEENQRKSHEDYQKEVNFWEKDKIAIENNYRKLLDQHEEAYKKWEIRKKEFEMIELKKRAEFPNMLKLNQNVMDKTLEDALNSLSWPRETTVSYQIMENGRVVWLDVDLPEIEDLPQKVASIAASGKKLNIKPKSKKQLQIEYASHIHGIAFRLVGTVYASLPASESVTISGYSQRLDNATGKINDDYLYSFKTDREPFEKIDFTSLGMVDPVAALGKFENHRKMTTTGIFKSIEPFTPE